MSGRARTWIARLGAVLIVAWLLVFFAGGAVLTSRLQDLPAAPGFSITSVGRLAFVVADLGWQVWSR